MRLSQLFTKTTKNVPADETARNAQLLIQAGFIHKEMAGVYAYLPLGLRVLENIKRVVREEMNGLGGQELIMSSLQRQELWEVTDRWSDENVDIWFKSELKNGTPIGFGWSHEEPITDMMKNFISSYRDVPVSVYQFQTKLRNELRAKSGIMRGREFVMKDMYSYSRNDEEHQAFYDAVTKAYLRIFERAGLGDITYLTFASGGAFTQFSHEFQTILEAGEDIIYVDKSKKLAVNKEVYTDEVLKQVGLEKSELEEVKAAEVGNIFSFGTAKSEQLGLYLTDETGSKQAVVLGSYGIGVTRLMGVVAEHFADDRGLVWPVEIAPAQIILVRLGDNPEVVKQADELYNKLTGQSVAVLYDERDMRAGEKFADADLMGIPYRVVISEKTQAAGAYELKVRRSGEVKQVGEAELFETLDAKP
ncbi:MAG TPA: aminoacyl--tRNA ligase-related protein [Candidatus Saccharimonadales bacterium]|nr:aminoacyl--tRNA ligase-related protein [Candidatus Saccharimonadales bacterium]